MGLLQHALSVRTQAQGGALSDRVHRAGLRSPDTQPRIVIVIHGYNNDLAQARRGYEKLLKRLEALLGDGMDAELFWGFYWPGDLAASGWLGSLQKTMSYPQQIPHAIDSGQLLGNWLSARDPRQDVILVAHSLGCRVALEALYSMAVSAAERGSPGPLISGLCLMAAAVPVEMCHPRRGRFGMSPQHRQEYVLYSGRDDILRKGFPVGQAVGGEVLLGPAVGYEGHPIERWRKAIRKDTGLRHGGYFDSDDAAQTMATLLERRVPRRLVQLSLPAWSLDRRVIEGEAQEGRELGTPIGGVPGFPGRS